MSKPPLTTIHILKNRKDAQRLSNAALIRQLDTEFKALLAQLPCFIQIASVRAQNVRVIQGASSKLISRCVNSPELSPATRHPQ